MLLKKILVDGDAKEMKKKLSPIFKKTNPRPEFKPRIRIAGMPTEYLLFLEPCIKRKQMLGWHPCDSNLRLNLRPRILFLNVGL